MHYFGLKDTASTTHYHRETLLFATPSEVVLAGTICFIIVGGLFSPLCSGLDSLSCSSRLSLSVEEPGPWRRAHVQLLLFLRPSVLVMECSADVSLTSAETLPRVLLLSPLISTVLDRTMVYWSTVKQGLWPGCMNIVTGQKTSSDHLSFAETL